MIMPAAAGAWPYTDAQGQEWCRALSMEAHRDGSGGAEALTGRAAPHLARATVGWVSAPLGAGVVETRERRLTDAEAAVVWAGDAAAARALADDLWW